MSTVVAERRVADVIAQGLAAAGARWVAGVAGGEVLHLADALSRAGLRYVAARHESAAGFVVEGAWHASGALPVLLATVGPGATNAVHVTANAAQDRVPLVVLTGAIDEDERWGYTHQLLDQVALYRTVAKASFSVTAGAVDEIMARALSIALEPPFGPVHLDVPVGVARALAPARVARTRTVPRAGSPEPALLEEARRKLRSAQRPLVIAGLEALAPDAIAAVRTLQQALGGPGITTYKAKGLLDERDERVLGGAGLSPSADATLLPLLGRADVVVLAGYDPIEMRRGWCEPFAPETFVIECAPKEPRHGVHRHDLALVGDLGATLRSLAATPVQAIEDAWSAAVGHARARLRETFSPEPAGWGPRAITHAIRGAWPDHGFVTIDTGAHRIVASQAWEARVPHRLLQSTGLCTMGCALPLAIGAALARGEPVLAITGDGGLDMILGELATARDLAVPVIVVVIDDQALGLIALKQRQERLPELGVRLGATDYAEVGRALGLHGERVTDVVSLARAIAAARARSGPTLLHCPIDPRSYDQVP